jgi:hypothetical protein
VFQALVARGSVCKVVPADWEDGQEKIKIKGSKGDTKRKEKGKNVCQKKGRGDKEYALQVKTN